MSYQILWGPRAKKELDKLPRDISARIVKKVGMLKDDPQFYLEKLVNDPGYKIRVGDYRVIADVFEQERIIAVRLVGHRRNIYKRM